MNKVINVVAAAAAGFVAGILLAPKSGKETRADLKRKAVETKEYVTDQAGVVADKAAAGYDAVREGAAEAGKEAAEFLGRAGKQAGEVAKDAKKTAGAVVEDAKTAGRNIRKAVK